MTVGLASSLWAAGASAGQGWGDLTAAQKLALAPLEREWVSIDAPRRAKWLEVAARFPSMPEAEKQRLQARMAEWTRLTPSQRSSARLQFQEARQVPSNERQAKWEAYQALSEDERRALAQKAKPVNKVASAPPVASTSSVAPAGKSNVLQATATPRSKAVSPTTQQARPGATTTTMTTRAVPPAHNQAGMPKIAATPGFVDSSTLLPKRGPQGAAVRSAAASSEPESQP